MTPSLYKLFVLLLLVSLAKCNTRAKQKTETQVDLSIVDFSDLESSATLVLDPLMDEVDRRLHRLFEKTKTAECRRKIAEHYGYFTKAFGLEKPFPFSEMEHFNNTCEDEHPWDFNNLPEGVHMGIVQNRTYQPPRTASEYISSHEVVLCYGILAHDSAPATIRLIEAVDEPTTIFIVHVDAKYEDTHEALKQYAATRPKIKVLDHPYRVRVNWGGFSMVNATMQLFHFADQLDFTHFVHIASTAYPIASNRRIRNTLASYPKDANFMHVILRPARPHPSIWNYYIECDDRLHRIYRLTPLTKETHNAEVYTTSQWFIISRDFVRYFANPEPGSFLAQYLEYVEHVVVADESFFGTVLRHTPFCNKHHNWNFLHLHFDEWENERDLKSRDERKCVMPDPNHCGRSPTTITLDYLDILELSGDLFARKFMDDVDSKIKDVVDTIRMKEEFELTSLNITEPRPEHESRVNLRLDGHGTLFVAKLTANSSMPLCLGLGETQNKVRLVPCFEDWVPGTLGVNWYTGAVILEETLPHNRWEIGPCSSDGNLKRLETGEIEVTSGLFTPTGPRCMIRMMDGLRAGRCLDGESLDAQPGGPVHVFPCTKRWNQFLSFGNGKDSPKMSIHSNVPLHIRKRIAETGREQEPYMCLGVSGRGKLDEEDWLGVRKSDEDEQSSDDEDKELMEEIDHDNFSLEGDDEGENGSKLEDGFPPLSQWEGKQLIATRCSNVGAVIEWVVVPFIVEDFESSNNIQSAEAEEL